MSTRPVVRPACRPTCLALAAASLAACSGTGAAPPALVDPSVWGDGHALTVATDIPPGTVATIAPGAHVSAAAGVTITVRGRLQIANATGPRATIAPAVSGETWGGIIVESGGTLSADGLDLGGATTALDVRAGDVAASYAHGTITAVQTPFQVARDAQLEVAHVTVVGSTASSGISGAFRASTLDYERSGGSGGVIMGDANAIFDVADSSFHGVGGAGGDFIISYGAALIHVAYSTVTNAHCGFHFDGVERFELDHVTAGATSPTGPGDGNAWGAMLYGSGAGPNVISNSNFMDLEANLDLQGTNGPLTITNTFSTGKNLVAGTWTWLPPDVATAPIANAKPR
jgi:hypothetical protein